MKYLYMARMEKANGRWECSVPDLPHCLSFGESLEEAAQMIADAAALMLAEYEDIGKTAPEATDPTEFRPEEGVVYTLLVIDTDEYRREVDTAPVRKSVSIPAWMDKQAQARGLSCSKVLQDALRALIG